MSNSEHATALLRAGPLARLKRPASRSRPGPGGDWVILLAGLFLLLAGLPAGWAQYAPPKIYRIDIKSVGPPAASDELIRANIRVKAGDPYLRGAVDDDVRNLYATGFFYNIQVAADNTTNGL